MNAIAIQVFVPVVVVLTCLSHFSWHLLLPGSEKYHRLLLGRGNYQRACLLRCGYLPSPAEMKKQSRFRCRSVGLHCSTNWRYREPTFDLAAVTQVQFKPAAVPHREPASEYSRT